MELDFIERKNYASYFLTVYDYVRLQRKKEFYARDVDRQQILRSVTVWALLLLTHQNTGFYLHDLCPMHAMNRRI